MMLLSKYPFKEETRKNKLEKVFDKKNTMI